MLTNVLPSTFASTSCQINYSFPSSSKPPSQNLEVLHVLPPHCPGFTCVPCNASHQSLYNLLHTPVHLLVSNSLLLMQFVPYLSSSESVSQLQPSVIWTPKNINFITCTTVCPSITIFTAPPPFLVICFTMVLLN